MRHLRYLLRNRIPTSLYRVAAYSTANKQEDSFVLQDLLERTEKYRKELRYHVRASPTARNIIRSVNVINQSIVEAKRKQLEEILDDMNQKPDIISLEVSSISVIHMLVSGPQQWDNATATSGIYSNSVHDVSIQLSRRNRTLYVIDAHQIGYNS
jgi:hypothetical protein